MANKGWVCHEMIFLTRRAHMGKRLRDEPKDSLGALGMICCVESETPSADINRLRPKFNIETKRKNQIYLALLDPLI